MNGTILTDDLANGTVTLAKLDDNSVTSAKIVDGSINNVDLALNCITSDKILDGSITGDDIGTAEITSNHLGLLSVTPDKLSVRYAFAKLTCEPILSGPSIVYFNTNFVASSDVVNVTKATYYSTGVFTVLFNTVFTTAPAVTVNPSFGCGGTSCGGFCNAFHNGGLNFSISCFKVTGDSAGTLLGTAEDAIELDIIAVGLGV
jgi:hypothetical protein